MREIKFKAWVKGYRKMVQVENIGFDYEGNVQWVTCRIADDEYEFSPDEVELLQYTGLKDKNGVEIYEGYIIKGQIVERYHRKGLVQFVDGKFTFTEFEQDGLLTEFEENPDAIDFYYDLEILGNQFENPELLQDTN